MIYHHNRKNILQVSLLGNTTLVNLAEGKPAAQSQTPTLYNYAVASKAVDGNKNSNFFDIAKSCTHTESTTSPWWRVDLQKVVGIIKV